GLDLAKDKQAVSFSFRGEPLGRKRINCPPRQLATTLQPIIGALCAKHELDRVLIGMEPASYFWELAAEGFEEAGLEYAMLHTLSVKREREATHYTPEKNDPRDADLSCRLVEAGKFTQAHLARCPKRAALDALAREYMLLRVQAGAEVARLKSLWGRVLPELEELFKEVDGVHGLAIGRALLPFSGMVTLTAVEWVERLKAHADGRILVRTATRFLDLVKAAHANPHRRSGEAVPLRIRMAAQRRWMLGQQKSAVAEQLLALYGDFEESVLLDSIPGSSPLYNAITLGLVGDFRDYDSSRAVVKLAGSEINEYSSGEWHGRSRISHRGRARLRAAAYQQAKLLVRGSESFRARYASLLGRLEKQQAYVAVGNSYLRTAHMLVTQGEPWSEDARSRRR
ncbi:MAG TPA: transposase, partial [Roseiflexaceae bacterium]|nr:transposase [Roseiflexaceae bacterium]